MKDLEIRKHCRTSAIFLEVKPAKDCLVDEGWNRKTEESTQNTIFSDEDEEELKIGKEPGAGTEVLGNIEDICFDDGIRKMLQKEQKRVLRDLVLGEFFKAGEGKGFENGMKNGGLLKDAGRVRERRAGIEGTGGKGGIGGKGGKGGILNGGKTEREREGEKRKVFGREGEQKKFAKRKGSKKADKSALITSSKNLAKFQNSLSKPPQRRQSLLF